MHGNNNFPNALSALYLTRRNFKRLYHFKENRIAIKEDRTNKQKWKANVENYRRYTILKKNTPSRLNKQ